MKKILFAVFLALLLAFSWVVNAANDATASSSQLKLGYVDFNRALNETSEGKDAKMKLETEFNERQQKLDIVQNELKKMKEELEKKSLILSQEALQKKEEEYRNKFMELQQKLATAKQEMAQKEAALTVGVLDKLKQIVKEIGEKDKYTLILEKSQDVVLYAPAIDDLTDQVITICNKRK
ncbi:MAG: OmpH family outer membrane protein [Pseudomonadota bacterium]